MQRLTSAVATSERSRIDQRLALAYRELDTFLQQAAEVLDGNSSNPRNPSGLDAAVQGFANRMERTTDQVSGAKFEARCFSSEDILSAVTSDIRAILDGAKSVLREIRPGTLYQRRSMAEAIAGEAPSLERLCAGSARDLLGLNTFRSGDAVEVLDEISKTIWHHIRMQEELLPLCEAQLTAEPGCFRPGNRENTLANLHLCMNLALISDIRRVLMTTPEQDNASWSNLAILHGAFAGVSNGIVSGNAAAILPKAERTILTALAPYLDPGKIAFPSEDISDASVAGLSAESIARTLSLLQTSAVVTHDEAAELSKKIDGMRNSYDARIDALFAREDEIENGLSVLREYNVDVEGEDLSWGRRVASEMTPSQLTARGEQLRNVFFIQIAPLAVRSLALPAKEIAIPFANRVAKEWIGKKELWEPNQDKFVRLIRTVVGTLAYIIDKKEKDLPEAQKIFRRLFINPDLSSSKERQDLFSDSWIEECSQYACV